MGYLHDLAVFLFCVRYQHNTVQYSIVSILFALEQGHSADALFPGSMSIIFASLGAPFYWTGPCSDCQRQDLLLCLGCHRP